MRIFKRSGNGSLSKIWWQSDKIILLCILLLLLVGILLVLTTSMFVAIRIGVDSFYFIKNHFFYLLVSVCIFFAIATRTKEQLLKIALFGMAISLILMVYIAINGQEIKGAKRWVYFLGFSLQPSEFMKVFMPIIFAYIVEYLMQKRQSSFRIYMAVFGMQVVLVALLLAQPDVGMTMLICMVFVILLFLSGLDFVLIIGLAITGVFIMLFSYFNFSHVKYRVDSFLFEQSTYQVSRSLQALKEGSLFGKGAGQGSIKEYLPDSHTDFIFTVGVEEFGLVFGVFIMLLYIVILYRSFLILKREKELFRFFAIAGLSLLIFLQAFIHIASNINLIPTKGMTLPLVSYGGSSLISMMLAVSFLVAFTKKDIKNIVLEANKHKTMEVEIQQQLEK